MPRDRPEDYGFRQTRGGHRWREWEGHGAKVGIELLDDETGEWAAYHSPIASNRSGAEYEAAFSEGSAVMHATEFARRAEAGEIPDATGEGRVPDDFSF